MKNSKLALSIFIFVLLIAAAMVFSSYNKTEDQELEEGLYPVAVTENVDYRNSNLSSVSDALRQNSAGTINAKDGGQINYRKTGGCNEGQECRKIEDYIITIKEDSPEVQQLFENLK